jgi:hypothetical protein
LSKALHGARCQMIVVIVRNKHSVYRRQIVQRERWRKEALWPGPLRRTCAFVPNRIDEHAHAINFNQGGGVPEPGYAQAGLWACGINSRIGVKWAQQMPGRPRCRSEEETRAHFEHEREPTHLGGHRVDIPAAIPLGREKVHHYSMVDCASRFLESNGFAPPEETGRTDLFRFRNGSRTHAQDFSRARGPGRRATLSFGASIVKNATRPASRSARPQAPGDAGERSALGNYSLPGKLAVLAAVGIVKRNYAVPVEFRMWAERTRRGCRVCPVSRPNGRDTRTMPQTKRDQLGLGPIRLR